jgi:hypothetical protein
MKTCPCAKHHAMRVQGEWGVTPHNLNLDTRQRWAVSFMPQKKSPWYQWIGGLVGPRASLLLLWIEPWSSNPQPSHYADYLSLCYTVYCEIILMCNYTSSCCITLFSSLRNRRKWLTLNLIVHNIT